MGVVYLAEDTALNRKVALKFLRPDALQSPQAQARLVHEARVASALDHPNIATIYEIGEWGGHHFIAMAYYEGETLAARLDRGPMPVPQVLEILTQIASALARAHAASVVHRDLKPANILLTPTGASKVLDFGLATHGLPDDATATRLTAAGTTVGTVSYMSPEQALGSTVDHRSDLWAFGIIAFEMLAGRRPFKGAHPAAILHAIMYEPVPDLKSACPDAPDALRRIVAQCLSKDPGDRPRSAGDLATDLARVVEAMTPSAAGSRSAFAALRRPVVAVPAVLALLAGAVLVTRWVTEMRSERWARDVAVPEVLRLVEAEQFTAAFDLARRADAIVPGHPILAKLQPRLARTPAILSEPPGASVYYKDYRVPDAPWRAAGTTPIEPASIPAGFFRWKVEKAGFEPFEAAASGGPAPPQSQPVLRFSLTPTSSAPTGMVVVPGTPDPYSLFLPGFEHLPAVRLADSYWIDRHEVTNDQFKAFVDAGGYRRPEFWQEPLVENGRTLAWQEAVDRFRDPTGRYAPATWVQGEYPAGQGSLPVGGISWHEAAAYARFVGKQLPTIYHWTKAAAPTTSLWVVPFSNFGGSGPSPVGSRNAMHPFGTNDMAGNVKEWVHNEAGDGKRYILGGGWDDPTYMFNEPDARSPFARERTFGFRLVTYSKSPVPGLLATVAWPTRDYRNEVPANDAVFEIYRRQYAYDRKPFQSAVRAVDDGDESWRREQIAFPAPYGDEEMKLFLYLPKKGRPPFETVVFFPGATFLRTRSFDQLVIYERVFDFIVKSGRAVALPIFKGTLDRKTDIDDSTATATLLYRDHVIMWVKDFSRAVDYLHTRQDLSIGRLALVGNSWGGRMGSIIPAIDDRVKAQVLMIGGFSMQQSQPEVDQINFTSRVKVPVLMLNGRYDFFFPVDASQRPMFEAFGTPKEDKRHILFEGGHNLPRMDMIRETLNWLDRYQPVAPR